MRNKDLVICNLEEAIEQLQETVSELRSNTDHSEIELKIELEHAYHHLNYAWNIRDVSEGELDRSRENYAAWSHKGQRGQVLNCEF